MASDDCLSLEILRSRGLEPREGLLPDATTCASFCDVIDENGHTVFQPDLIPRESFDEFLRESAAAPDRPTVRTIEGHDYFAYGRGQVFAFPPECTRGVTSSAYQYHCPREDGLTDNYAFRSVPGTPLMQFLQEVRRTDGTLIRSREHYLSGEGVDKVEGRSWSTWYVDGIPYLGAIDGWGEGSRSIAVQYLNPYRNPRTEIQKAPHTLSLDVFSFEEPWQRHGFYHSVDQMIARHDFSLYPKERTIVVDGRAVHFIGHENSSAVTEAEVWDNLFAVVPMADFLPLIDIESYLFFIGSLEEMMEMAYEYGVAGCLPQQGYAAWSCDDQRTIFLYARPRAYREGRIHGHRADLKHEFGHALLNSHRDVISHDFFVSFVRGALEAAGVTGDDLAFLMRIPMGQTSMPRMAQNEKDRLQALWRAHHLERVFRHPYALSNVGEFFSEAMEVWHPWHAYEADRLPYHGFLAALEGLTRGENFESSLTP